MDKTDLRQLIKKETGELTFPFKSDRLRSAESLSEVINDELSPETVKKLHSFFSSIDFNVDEFMKARSYNLVADRKERNALLSFILNEAPISCDIFPDVASGNYIELWEAFHNPDGSNTWKDGGYTHLDEDTMRFLFFCDSERDVWRMLAAGIGDIHELFYYYYKRDEKQSRAFLLFVRRNALFDTPAFGFAKSLSFAMEVSQYGKEHSNGVIVDVLVDGFLATDYYDIDNEAFFSPDNYEKAKDAWKTGIQSIRKEFVRDNKALTVLKRILDEEYVIHNGELMPVPEHDFLNDEEQE